MSRITIEPANGTRRVRWYAIVALILAPLLLAGAVILAVNNTTSRLGTVTAAIVNNDAGTKIDGQNVPLGRQLTAGLVKGTDDADLGNYTWVLSDDADAAAGLADGSYTAVVTIPKNFSKDATSFADAETATQARIDVTTSDKDRVADGVISTFIANTAASIFGTELSKNYLDGIYVGFNTLGDKLGEAADGAQTLADGSQKSAAGGQKLAAGLQQSADGAQTLADGTQKSADGAQTLASGATGLAGGTTELADGLDDLAGGVQKSATGATNIASGTSQYVAGARSLANGLTQLASGAQRLPAATAQLATGMSSVASGVDKAAQIAAENPDMTVAELDARLKESGSSLQLLADRANQVSQGTVAFGDGVERVADATTTAAQGASTFANEGKPLAAGATELAGGLDKLAAGSRKSADGAHTLASNSTDFAAGLGAFAAGSTKLADGTTDLADGTTQLADGTTELANGNSKLADGTTKIADGLEQAVDGIPTYSKSERTTLADVVTAPVSANVSNIPTLIAKSALPLLVSLALWFGAFAVYLVMQAASRRALTSRRGSLAIAASSYLPGLIVGVIQGIAVAALAQFSLQLDVGSWFGLAGVAALAGASFAAVIQGLVALFGNAGRLVAAVAAAVALAAGLISTAPAFLLSLAGFLPTSAASTAISAVISGTPGAGGALMALVVWALFGFALSAAAVIRRRSVSVRQLAALPVG